MSATTREFRTDVGRWWWLMLVPVPWLGFALWEAHRHADSLALLLVGGPAVAAAPILWFALKLKRFSVGPTTIEVTAPYQRKIVRSVDLSRIVASVFQPNWPYRMGRLCVYGHGPNGGGADDTLVPIIVLDTRGLSTSDLEWIAHHPPLKVQSHDAT
jgi:hypothetical protein